MIASSQTTAVALPERMTRLRARRAAIWAAVKLGWAIEANWTDPFVFMIYQVVRPLFGAGILIVMFTVVTGKPANDPSMAQLFIGQAFFFMVLLSLENTGTIVFFDRERFQMIRYVYLAPIGFGWYMAARGLSQVIALMTAVVVTLTFGILIMGMPLSITPAEVPHLLLLLFLGGIATLALGVLLASITLTTAFHGLSIPDGVGGVLFLVSGAVFSFDILPGWVNSISRVLPWTYWLEGIRRIIVDRPFIASLQGLSDTDVMLMLVYGTVGAVAAAWATLRICTHAAISSGGLDMKTDH